MELITEYTNKSDLKRKIIAKYLEDVNMMLEINNELINDKNWAASNTGYHIQCRKELEREINSLTKQVRLLK